MPLRQGGVEQPVEQHQRQIVDHFPAHVLQRLERGGLARARQAGNEQYGLRRFETHDGLALFRPMFLTASSTLIGADASNGARRRSEEHTSELQYLMRISYAVVGMKKKKRVQSNIDQTSIN